MTPLPPGKIPRKKPIRVPLPIGAADLRQSCFVGNRFLKSRLHHFLLLVELLQVEKYFRDAKEPHGNRNEPHTINKPRQSECKACLPRDHVLPDEAQIEAEPCHASPLRTDPWVR